jgi:membrane-associated protease RseP (regulator of RpoE activity)
VNVTSGVIVRELSQNSPALASGIQPGDIILQVDDLAITGVPDLATRLLSLPAGYNALVKIMRAGKPIDVEVKLAARELSVPPTWFERTLEFQLSRPGDIEARIKDLQALRLNYRTRNDLSKRESREAQSELSLEIRRLEERLLQANQRRIEPADNTDRPSTEPVPAGTVVIDLNSIHNSASTWG